MARMFVKKNQDVKKIPVSTGGTGMLDGKEVSLSQNEVTGRFSLKSDGSLMVSGSFAACMERAEVCGVEWSNKPELSFKLG